MGNFCVFERTLKESFELSGIGLHTGKPTKVIVEPAPPATGIVIRRIDKSFRPYVRAYCENISSSMLATTIGFNGIGVSTVEHLMAALMGCGVDNAFVEVDGPEIPIVDGSAFPFVKLIMKVGLKEQNKSLSFLRVKKPFKFHEKEIYAVVEPADGFFVSYSIDFPHPCIGYQSINWKFSVESFIKDIAPARTFGFLKDVEVLKSKGFALGGSLENAIVFSETSILNPEGLRFKDECVRHKVLDLLGDIKLMGIPVIGRFVFHKGGHSSHHKVLKMLRNYLEVVDARNLPEEVTANFRPSFLEDPLEKSLLVEQLNSCSIPQ